MDNGYHYHIMIICVFRWFKAKKVHLSLVSYVAGTKKASQQIVIMAAGEGFQLI